MTLVRTDPPLNLLSVALDPPKDRRRVELDTPLLHHLGEVAELIACLQYHRTHSRMISTGKRRRLKIDNRAAPG